MPIRSTGLPRLKRKAKASPGIWPTPTLPWRHCWLLPFRKWSRSADISPRTFPSKTRKTTWINQESHFFFADSVFFDMFSFRFEQGVPETLLDQPNSVVLTHSTARRYFKNENPVGKSLLLEGGIDVRVTGVIEDPPANSSLQFDFISCHGQRA